MITGEGGTNSFHSFLTVADSAQHSLILAEPSEGRQTTRFKPQCSRSPLCFANTSKASRSLPWNFVISDARLRFPWRNPMNPCIAFFFSLGYRGVIFFNEHDSNQPLLSPHAMSSCLIFTEMFRLGRFLETERPVTFSSTLPFCFICCHSE